MKKALSLIVLSCAVFAVTSNPAHASPPTADHPVIMVDDMQTQFAITPLSLKYEAVEAFVTEEILPVVNLWPSPAAVAVPSEILKEDVLAPDERIRMYRHYFIHEDNKQYQEYRPDNLSDGFIKPLDKPAR